ncbi:hypothetical protein DFH08DRAFT_944096 [Mycena albidolilacea]|uniref:Uncharacterized protein n=1 Tax=Mycena albidolilacea TaxID=1033008 RepID=A0AAD7EBI3_9AGAR|nr:hypothetical protein DFH08DRAFT_944096 [Mycena albidolilacea]
MVTLRAIAPPAPRLGTPTHKTVRFVSPPRLEPDASTLPSDSNSESKLKPTSHHLGPLFTRPPSNSKTKRNPNPKLSTPLLLASRRAQVILRRISRTARVLGKLARLIRQRAKEEAKNVSQCRCASDWFCPLHGFTAAAPPPRALGEVRVIPSRRALPVELPMKAEGTGGKGESANLRGDEDEGAGARWRAEHARCTPPPRTLRSRPPTPAGGGGGDEAGDADDADEAAVALSPSHDSDADADSDSDSDSNSDDSDPTPWPWNDLHLGFAPPPTAHEPDLDYPTRLAMFKVMRHLGRRDRADVEMLEDAFVMRNLGAAEIRRKELQEEEAEDQEDDEEEEEVDAYGCIGRKTALPGAPAPPPPWYKGAGCLSR